MPIPAISKHRRSGRRPGELETLAPFPGTCIHLSNVGRHYVCSFQHGHASARFSNVVGPPSFSGVTWSIGKVATCPRIGSRQYSQRFPARAMTAARTFSEATL